MAIYTDMGFLPSIGQETAAEGASWPKFSLAALIEGSKIRFRRKAGSNGDCDAGRRPNEPNFRRCKGN